MAGEASKSHVKFKETADEQVICPRDVPLRVSSILFNRPVHGC